MGAPRLVVTPATATTQQQPLHNFIFASDENEQGK